MSRALHFIFWAGAAVFAIAIVCSLCLWIGKDLGRQEALARMDAPKPAQMMPVPACALTQWTCEAQEFREHLSACKGRLRLGKVGG